MSVSKLDVEFKFVLRLKGVSVDGCLHCKQNILLQVKQSLVNLEDIFFFTNDSYEPYNHNIRVNKDIDLNFKCQILL